jgi:hypothetical protein
MGQFWQKWILFKVQVRTIIFQILFSIFIFTSAVHSNPSVVC